MTFSNKTGLQGLACGLVGVVLWFILDQLGLHRISMAAGVILALTLMFVVLGAPRLGSFRVWAAIALISLLNVMLGLYLFYLHDESPGVMAPFFLIELVVYSKFLDRIKARQTQA
jgi:hypothetical protein